MAQVFLDVGHVGRAWEVYIAHNPVRSGPLPSIAKLQVQSAGVDRTVWVGGGRRPRDLTCRLGADKVVRMRQQCVYPP